MKGDNKMGDLKTISKKELQEILENHKHWLNKDCDSWETMQADLSKTDLSNMDLSYSILVGANLACSDLKGANLSYSNLTNANLINANLSYSRMERVKLCNSDLESSNLNHSNLRYADLSHAYMPYADLESSNLTRADLNNGVFSGSKFKNSAMCYSDFNDASLIRCDFTYTNLIHATFCDADLYKSDLSNSKLAHVKFDWANLKDVNFKGCVTKGMSVESSNIEAAKNTPYIPMACPEEGSFIGYKKANFGDLCCIVTLRIPEEAKRSSGFGHKCRCNMAKVINIELIGVKCEKISTAQSIYDPYFIYEVGKIVKVDNFDENRFNECAPGIHFFINKQEAINY